MRLLDALKNPFAKEAPKKAKQLGLETVPPGGQMIPMQVKRDYETNPIHFFHPTPYNAITILRNKKNAHEYLVCGWYLDTFREHGVVKGLVYKAVSTDEDKEHVVAEMKKMDKEAIIKFGL